MPKLEYFLVAESISTDQETNAVSLFHVLEELQPERFPAAIRQLVAVSCWNREPDDLDRDFQLTLQVRQAAPSAETAEFHMNFVMESRRFRSIFRIANVAVMNPGDITFDLLLNGRHAAEHTLIARSPDSLSPG